uniref:Uncharacterized protein n=1 Tax=Caenorhabditis japonica TaxID=281687 RepID=A0A8R1E1T7_CAEJA
MEVEQMSNRDMIERSLCATEKAIDLIREGDLARRTTALELRDMQISMHEDFERLRGLMRDFDDQIYKERTENAKWMDRKLAKARATADQALSSILMVKDVQLLEKKVDILKDSVIQVNKAYYNYEKNADMQDLMDQVTEMVYRTEKKEKDALDGKITDEKTMESAFRGAIEGLFGLKSANPRVMEEAKKLAAELRVFRDAAANNNFHTMIAKQDAYKESDVISDCSERSFTSGSKSTSSSSKQTSAEKVSRTSSSQMTL